MIDSMIDNESPDKYGQLTENIDKVLKTQVSENPNVDIFSTEIDTGICFSGNSLKYFSPR